MKYTSRGPFQKGYNSMITEAEHPEMMGMEFGVVAMSQGDRLSFNYAQEVVYDLLFGEVTFGWNGEERTVRREDCFHEGAILLHVPQNTEVTICCGKAAAARGLSVCQRRTRRRSDAGVLHKACTYVF